MTGFAPVIILVSLLSAVEASAQLGMPQGDFREHGSQPAPTVGATGGPSLPPGSRVVTDPVGTKPPEDVLNQLNKQLGSDTFGISRPGGHNFEPQRDTIGGSRSSPDRTLR
jgi:hypothetical protein